QCNKTGSKRADHDAGERVAEYAAEVQPQRCSERVLPRKPDRDAGGDAATHRGAVQSADQTGQCGAAEQQPVDHTAGGLSRPSPPGVAAGGGGRRSSSASTESAGVSRSSNWPRRTAQTNAQTA